MALDFIMMPDGSVRKLGNNSKGVKQGARAVYGESANEDIFPRADWEKLIAQFSPGPESPFLPYVHDQDGVGQCNCDATVAGEEYARAMQGLPFVKLSAPDLYDRINGGGDNGSMLEDALHETTTAGVGSVEASGGNTVWHRGQRQASAAERGRFRVLEWKLLPTFEHLMSAAIKGRPLISGVDWCSNYTPDADGWLPNGRGQSGGHAILGYKPTWRSGRPGVWHQNSWTTSWGYGGRMVLHEGCYQGQVGGWWALCSVTDEGGVVPQQ